MFLPAASVWRDQSKWLLESNQQSYYAPPGVLIVPELGCTQIPIICQVFNVKTYVYYRHRSPPQHSWINEIPSASNCCPQAKAIGGGDNLWSCSPVPLDEIKISPRTEYKFPPPEEARWGNEIGRISPRCFCRKAMFFRSQLVLKFSS